MLPPLESLFDNRERPESDQLAAANAIAFFAAQNPKLLGELLLRASDPQFKYLFDKYQDAADEDTKTKFATIVPSRLNYDVRSPQRIVFGKRRTTSAITLLRLGERESILDVLRYAHDNHDPEALTQFVQRCRSRGVKPSDLIDLLNTVDRQRGPLDGNRRKIDDSVMYGLLLALGEFSWDELPGARDKLAERLNAIYELDPSSGVHSATGWVLRSWGQRETVDRVDQSALAYNPSGNREWFVREVAYPIISNDNPSGKTGRFYLTFIVFQPTQFVMGSPVHAAGHQYFETQHRVTLSRPVAVCDRELTWEQWESCFGRRKRQSVVTRLQRKLGDNAPVCDVSWFECVVYCRWLSEQAGCAEDEQCYENPTTLRTNDELYPMNWPLRLESPGFRLPTEAEWELACRSGTHSVYSFGHDEKFLERYAWWHANSANGPHTTCQLRPNPRVLFDMHGNVFEWCHDWFNSGELSDSTDPLGVDNSLNRRVNRGGSWVSTATLCGSSDRFGYSPSNHNDLLGFRLAVTLPRSSHDGQKVDHESESGNH